MSHSVAGVTPVPKSRVLGFRSHSGGDGAAREPAGPLRILAGLGGALALVGWVDIGLILVPPRIGNPDWEFGMASTVFDSLPLGTVGLGLLLFALASQRRTWPVATVAVFCGAVLFGLMGVLGLYGLALPQVWRAANAPAHGALALAVGKTTLMALVYLSLYAWLAVVAWRCARLQTRMS